MAVAQDVDMSFKIRDVVFKNPVLTASGTFGYADEFEDFTDVSSLGAVVTKAISMEPRPGNDHQRIFETYGGMINSIGLENVGIEKFVEEKLPVLKGKNIDFVVNLAGKTLDEYVSLAKVCEEHNIKAVELNISCPNVKSGCLEFGTDEVVLGRLVDSVRKVFDGCLIVKLTPNVTSIEKIAQASQQAGADAVSLINTVKALGIKLDFINGKFKKSTVQGGLSGRAIKPIALGAVSRVRQVVDIPIIGMGGIYSLFDMFEFFSAGADMIQIGTANFTHPDISGQLVCELKNFMAENGFSTLKELKDNLRGEY